jgi:hypothetical protein
MTKIVVHVFLNQHTSLRKGCRVGCWYEAVKYLGKSMEYFTVAYDP